MVTRSKFGAYVLREYEDLTQETVGGGWPLQFVDDFVGAGPGAGIPVYGSPVAGCAWCKKIVGSPTGVATVANAVGGQIAAALAATSEAEEALLAWNDALSYDVTREGMVEFRAALSVLPTGVAGASIGAGSAWVSGGTLSFARYLAFGWAASGALLVTALDGVQGAVSLAAKQIGGAAITSDTAQHIFRIDWNNPSDIAFLYDGNRVNTAGSVTWTATAGANSVMQPIVDVYKASGVGVATLTVDKVAMLNSR